MDQEQASTRANSCLLSSTKWNQKPSILKAFAQSLGNRMTPIGYNSSEAKDEMKLEDYDITRPTSQSLQNILN